MNNSKKIIFAVTTLLASTVLAAAGPITVYKTPWCGCCHEWVQAVEKAGYQVTSVNLEDLSQVREQAGVPGDMEGCHIAMVDGYFLEGHVPLEAIARLLAERPDAAGLAVPGMPQGSPGMGSDASARYQVYAVPRDRASEPFVFYQAGN